MPLKKNISSGNEDTQLLTVFQAHFTDFLNLARIRFICLFISSLCKVRSVNYSKLSSGFDTNIQESISYMKVMSTGTILVMLGVLILSFVLLKFKFTRFNRKWSLLLIVFIISLPLKNIIQYGWTPKYIDNYFDVISLKKTSKYFYLMDLVKQEDELIQIESAKPNTWSLKESKEKHLVTNFVIVVGESARKDFMNAYGFSQDNTPFMTNSNRILFQNYIAVSPQTVPSLSRSLALSEDFPKYELNNNIINLAKLIGYETAWLSNQGQVGYNDSPITIISSQADESVYLNKGDYQSAADDFLLFPEFKKRINQDANRLKLIVLHLMGSHPYSCDRTQGEYDEFVQSKDISCYIKSIKNTDGLLEQIYHQLNETGKDFKLIYFSDHGLIINDDLSFSHGKGLKPNYEVPLAIWGNDIEGKIDFNATRTGKDFLHLFLELNQVKVENINKNYQFISEEPNDDEGKIKVLNSDEVLVDYNELEDNQFNIR